MASCSAESTESLIRSEHVALLSLVLLGGLLGGRREVDVVGALVQTLDLISVLVVIVGGGRRPTHDDPWTSFS